MPRVKAPRGLPGGIIRRARRELGAGASWSDVFRRAWEIYKGGALYRKVFKGNPRRVTRKRVRRAGMPRRRVGGRRRRRTRKIPLAPVIGLGAGILGRVPGAPKSNLDYIKDGDWYGFVHHLVIGFTGYHMDTGTFDFTKATGLYATLGGLLIHKIASWLGVNRIFGRLPSPLNKLAI